MPFVKTYVLRMNTEIFVFYSQMRVYYKITLITGVGMCQYLGRKYWFMAMGTF